MFTNRILSLARFRIVSRTFSTCHPTLNAQKSPLFQLRQKTGLAYNLCREALNKHDNNVAEAEIWLQAQALAHGLQKATKVGSRSTKEGLVSLAVDQENKSITMLELNCETDFVAKNQIFKDFTIDLAEQVASSHDGFLPHQTHVDSNIEEFIASTEKLDSISNQIAPLLTRLGENIRVHRVCCLKSKCNDINIYGQIHAQAIQKKTDHFDIHAGRFGAIIALKLLSDSQKPSKAIGNRLCHHVIGFSPTYIELPEELRKSLEEAEKAKANLQTKPAEEIDEEEHEESEEIHLGGNNRDDWPSIMDQQLIMSDDQTVREYCEENQISIVYFRRFECGIES